MDSFTKLKYLEDSYLLNDHAAIIDVNKDEKGNDVIILDQTIFYPQGSGQPYDQGIIKNENAEMKINEVRFFEGKVHHIGQMIKGIFSLEDKVNLIVDETRRSFNRRNHTAGHLIDIAIKTIGEFTPVKGFHFPEGAYVEYQGVIDESKREEIKAKIQQEVDKIIASNLGVVCQLTSIDELRNLCDFVPEWLPKDKPIRIVKIGDYKAHPCGGTHVRLTGEIKKMTIEKISSKKGNTRISYKIE